MKTMKFKENKLYSCNLCLQETDAVFYGDNDSGWLCEECLVNEETEKWLEDVVNATEKCINF